MNNIEINIIGEVISNLRSDAMYWRSDNSGYIELFGSFVSSSLRVEVCPVSTQN